MNNLRRGVAALASFALIAVTASCGDQADLTEAQPNLLTPAQDYAQQVLDIQLPPGELDLTRAQDETVPVTVAVCHKYGTPAEKTLVLPLDGAAGHVAGHGDFYGTCAGTIIDADGTASPGDGVPDYIEVTLGDALTSWPTGGYVEGIDWFDTDGNCTWTMGDDLHVEGPLYAGAIRDGIHDDNASYFDPLVLDLDGSLLDGDQVDVDLETGTTFTGCPGVDPLMKFFDANGNGFWDNGEDIVLDLDGDGIFN